MLRMDQLRRGCSGSGISRGTSVTVTVTRGVGEGDSSRRIARNARTIRTQRCSDGSAPYGATETYLIRLSSTDAKSTYAQVNDLGL
jgi:hypothetical protein